MYFLVCEETQKYCMQFLLPLRGKYQTEWPFTWQETRDVGQHMVKYLFCEGKFQRSEDHGFVLFPHGIFDWQVSTASVVGNATIASSKC